MEYCSELRTQKYLTGLEHLLQGRKISTVVKFCCHSIQNNNSTQSSLVLCAIWCQQRPAGRRDGSQGNKGRCPGLSSCGAGQKSEHFQDKSSSSGSLQKVLAQVTWAALTWLDSSCTATAGWVSVWVLGCNTSLWLLTFHTPHCLPYDCLCMTHTKQNTHLPPEEQNMRVVKP